MKRLDLKKHNLNEHNNCSNNHNFKCNCENKIENCDLEKTSSNISFKCGSCESILNDLDDDPPQKNIFFKKNIINKHHHDHHDSNVDNHHDHSDHTHAFIPNKKILIFSLILTLIGIFSMFINASSINTFKFLSGGIYGFITGTIIFILIGVKYIYASYISFKKREITEDLLVSISVTSAYLYSSIIFFISIFNSNYHPEYFFNESVEIASVIYLGRWIEEWLSEKLKRDINSLENLQVKTAIKLVNNEEFIIDINDVQINDILLVKLGQKIPTDGIVIKGSSTINESMFTGESIPITKEIGSTVFGGTISETGTLTIKVTKIIGDSFVSKIIEGVKKAQTTKPNSQRMADKIALILLPTVLILAVISLSFWWIFSGFEIAIKVMITVLVIACPCSFAMTTPMSVLVSTTKAKKSGITFNSKELFEQMDKIDIVAFDKTGTLTEGKFSVNNVNIDKKYISAIFQAEQISNHPIAKSIVKYFETIKINNKNNSNQNIEIEEIIGKGMKINLGNENLYFGSHKFVKSIIKNWNIPEDLILKKVEGKIFTFLFNEKGILGHIELEDKIKSTTKASLDRLIKNGFKIVMITGDSKETAQYVANKLGINLDNVFYDVDPLDKSEIILDLQNQGKKIAYVGDGVNDSVALKQSDIGISFGEGSEVAIETADVVLNVDNLDLVVYSILLSKRTLWNIKRGFIIAIIYNLIAVPIAMSGVIPPMVGATSMVLNDCLAMINASTLSLYNNKNAKNKKQKKQIK